MFLFILIYKRLNHTRFASRIMPLTTAPYGTLYLERLCLFGRANECVFFVKLKNISLLGVGFITFKRINSRFFCFVCAKIRYVLETKKVFPIVFGENKKLIIYQIFLNDFFIKE